MFKMVNAIGLPINFEEISIENYIMRLCKFLFSHVFAHTHTHSTQYTENNCIIEQRTVSAAASASALAVGIKVV